MSVEWVLGAALLGAVSGSVLRRPMFTLAVDPGQPNRSSCPHCGEWPIKSLSAWHGRCARCASRIGPRWASIEVLCALLSAAAVMGFGHSLQAIGVATVAVIGVALAVIDLRSLRLPNRLIGLAAVLLGVCLLATAIHDGHWGRVLPAALGAVGLAGSYLLLAVIRPGQLGLGDVKLAAMLGLLLGWFGWPQVVLGGCLAFLLSALTILLLLALRKITLRSHIPFGPFMLAGAAVVLFL